MLAWLFKKKPEALAATVPAKLSLLAPAEDFNIGASLEDQYRFWLEMLQWTQQDATKKFFALQQRELLFLYDRLTGMELENAPQLSSIIAARLKQQDMLTQFPLEVGSQVVKLKRKLDQAATG